MARGPPVRVSMNREEAPLGRGLCAVGVCVMESLTGPTFKPLWFEREDVGVNLMSTTNLSYNRQTVLHRDALSVACGVAPIGVRNTPSLSPGYPL